MLRGREKFKKEVEEVFEEVFIKKTLKNRLIDASPFIAIAIALTLFLDRIIDLYF